MDFSFLIILFMAMVLGVYFARRFFGQDIVQVAKNSGGGSVTQVAGSSVVMVNGRRITSVSGMGNVREGKGPLGSRRFNPGSFTGLNLEQADNVRFEPGSDYSVTIETEKNLLDIFSVKVEGGELRIFARESYSSQAGIVITITAPVSPDCVAVSGAATLSAIMPEAGRLQISIDGSGDISIKGRAESLDLSISGSGEFKGRSFQCESVEVDISGSGEAEIFARHQAKLNISGSGEITVYGNPGRCRQSVSGSGEIRFI